MKIYSIISSLCIALGAFAFQACDDVPAPYDIPQQGSASIYGSGTLDDPYSVQGASLNQSGGYAWVQGYIVGYIPLASTDNESYTISDVVFATDGAATSNIVIADDADETDINSCMAVQLPSGDVRSALNLSDHPENIGQAVFLYGTMERYYGASGVKNVTAAILNGEEIGDMPEEETEAIFSADFSSSLGDFTSISASGSLTWYNDYSSAMITGYQNYSNTAGVTYLVSPSIDLSQVTEAYVSVNMAINYERGDINENNAVLISKDYAGDVNAATWTQLTYDTDGLNSDFTFRDKGMNIPSEFMGGNIVVAFRHTCSETYSSTWEVKSISVIEGTLEEDSDEEDTITGENLVANGGFETWENGEAVGWTPSNTACNTTISQSTDARNGNYSVMVEGSTEQNRRLGSSEMSLKAGTYSITAYVKAVNADASIRLGYAINESDGSISGGNSYVYGNYVNNITSSEWTEATYQFTLTETTRLNLIVMVGSNPGQSVLIDDYSLTTADGGIAEDDDEESGDNESTLTFVKTTEIRSGARYIISAMIDGASMVAQNLSESYTYGYLQVTSATEVNDEISTVEQNTFTFTESNGSYTIQDSYGRYLYMTGSYNTFNVSEALPNSGYLWSISFDADGLATITNVDMGKWIQYSTAYSSFGSYSTTQSGGVLPYLYVEN